MLTKPLPVVIACGLIAVGAAVHGAATRRWDALAPDPVRAAAAHALVLNFADCEPGDVPHDIPLKERSTATSRRYSSAKHEFVAVVSIISGPPGAVATHTPDVCYSGNGYMTLRGPVRETVSLPGGGTATFLVADFERKRESSVERYRVRWAWSAGGVWAAPDRARFAYLKEPELFKLYVVTPLPADGPAGDDPQGVTAFVSAAFAQFATVLARK